MGERLTGSQEVVGSIPISSTSSTSLARRLAVKNGLVADQRTWSGLVKEKEASHDAAVGRACRAEIEALARKGAKVRRIRIDAELKSLLARRSETARAREGKAEADRERRLAAAELQLPIDRDGHVLVPDAQLEYTDAAGQIGRVNVEVGTGHYREGAVAAKTAAGFSMHGARGSGGSRSGGIGSFGGGTGRRRGGGGRGEDPASVEI